MSRFIHSMVTVASLVVFAPCAAQQLAPIHETELVRYLAIIGPSDEEAILIQTLFMDYLKRFDALIRADLEEYSAQWRSAENSQAGGRRPRARAQDEAEQDVTPLHERYRRIYEAQTDLVRRLEALDSWLFNEIESLLDLSLQERIRRARHARLRFMFRDEQAGPLELRVDLVEIARPFAQSETELHNKVLDAYLDEYERRYIDALRHVNDVRRQWRVVWHEGNGYEELINSERMAARLENRTAHEELIDQWTAARDRHHDRAGRMAVAPYYRLRDLLHDGVIGIRNRLGEADRPVFEAMFNRTAYPTICPDPGSAETLYEIALELPDLSESQRTVIVELRDRYRVEHNELSRRMAVSELERTLAGVRNEPNPAKRNADYWSELFALGESREALNERQAVSIRAILTPEQSAGLPVWSFKTNPPARPWDPADAHRRERERREQERRDRARPMQDRSAGADHLSP